MTFESIFANKSCLFLLPVNGLYFPMQHAATAFFQCLYLK